MDGNSWPILDVRYVSLKDFVRFWERLYSGYDENFYQENIGQPLTEERIAQWYEWKNGRALSTKKNESIRKYGKPAERIGLETNTDTLREFLNRPGGAIWRIFWLHLQHPRHYPIYDQHVHRAMAFMLKRTDLNIPTTNPAKVRAYLQEYRLFFAQFHECHFRQVDRALWSFGRFLQTEYANIVGSPPNQEDVESIRVFTITES